MTSDGDTDHAGEGGSLPDDLAVPEMVNRLRLRVKMLEMRARRDREESESANAELQAAPEWTMLSGSATTEGTRRFAANTRTEFDDFYRLAQGLHISSLGIGTNLGKADNETDLRYARAIEMAVRGGVNLIDTSISYRHQRSERAAAIGLRAFLEGGHGARDSIVVCSKGGYVVPGAVREGTLATNSIVGGIHSMAPAFLVDQIERSRRNLGLETIDVYYLHNPEVQLRFVDDREFMRRIRAAFEMLELAVVDGRIAFYGTATWEGYRTGLLSLRRLVEAARQIAGDGHHFRFVQLPFNLGMQEARTNHVDKKAGTVLDVAEELDVTVIASASLAQGPALDKIPTQGAESLSRALTPAQLAIHFVRSTPGICTALVGMRSVAHVKENLFLARIPPANVNP